jgi:iron complex outermembrane receptor protein
MRTLLLRTLSGLVTLFVLAGPVAGQTGSITGRLTAADTGDPLRSALVEALDVGGRAVASTLSNQDGRYLLRGLAAGTYTVAASAIGYGTQQVQSVQVTAGGTANADASLQAVAFELNPVVVTASKKLEKAISAPARVEVVTESEIQARPTITPVDHLRSVPGVDVITTGLQSTNVVVRGFNNIFSGALHTLTDYRIASVPSLRVNFMHFIPQSNDDIARMEVVLGPGSALYGPNTANGVLHILTKSPLDDQSTTASIAGGEQSLFDGTFRTAQKLGDNFAVKLSAQYLKAKEFTYRDASEDSIALALQGANLQTSALFPPSMPLAERQLRAARIANRDFDIERWSGDVRADWRATDRLTAVFSGGITNDNSI